MAGDNLPYNFSWIIPGALVGQGCTLLVTLSPETEPHPSVRALHRLRNETLDWKEFAGAKVSELIEITDLIQEEISNGGAVTVHCRAGNGRTGTLIAAYLMRFEKISAKQAMQKIRGLRARSVESRGQERCLTELQEYLENPL